MDEHIHKTFIRKAGAAYGLVAAGVFAPSRVINSAKVN